MPEFRIVGVGTADIPEKGKEYVMDALRTQRLSYGPYMQRFEREFAKLHSRAHGLMCNSGTSALMISIAALKEIYNWKDGDEVIVPAVTFVASSNVVMQNGLVPVFVDVDPKIYNMNPSKIEDKISSRTKAIMPVHLFGLPCDMDPIMEIAKKYDLKVVEDSCETMFSKYKGRPVGSFGDMGCFSTYVAHLLVTGVGGLVLCDSDEYAVTLRSLINHGRDSIYISIDDDETADKKKLNTIMERRFSFIRPGYSFRATEMEGALGCAQLERKDEILSKRKKNAKYLTDALSEFSNRIQLPTIPAGSEHAFMMFPIVVRDKKVKRDALTLYLEERGIETRHMLPLINQPFYVKLFGNLEAKYPVARWINANGFYIGCHQALGESDLEHVVDAFEQFFKANK